MIYVFEDYELDTQRYELRRRGVLCPLEPQGFNVLVYLVSIAIAWSARKNCSHSYGRTRQ